MNPYVKQLEERIRRLKSDALARKEWNKLRIEIEKHGGKWRAENGMVFELVDGAIYQYVTDYKGGVSQLVITAMDAEVPYVASLEYDLQGTPPERRRQLIHELEETARTAGNHPVETVTIVKGDWLSRISLARWGTIDWKRHLRPTEMTLSSRAARGVPFNPDLIYPGDTFEVVT